MTSHYLVGQFVWCQFPNREQPDQPGPKTRVGYVYAVASTGVGAAAMLYTTTARWPGSNIPLGVIPVEERQASAMGQRPFAIDARTVAILPVTAEYFPYLAETGHGVQGHAPPKLVRRVEATLTNMRVRGLVIEVRGPRRT